MNEPAIEEHGVVKFLGEGAGKVDALGAVDLAIRQRLRRRPEVLGESTRGEVLRWRRFYFCDPCGSQNLIFLSAHLTASRIGVAYEC
jgi:hypothetical protein